MAYLEMSGVKKRFGSFQVIHGLDLQVEEGEFVVFVGPSGCGKSTALRMICGLEGLSDGDICIDGASVRNVPPSKRGVAMVFQSYALYPHMTVAENMGFSLRLDGTPKSVRLQKVREAAQALQLQSLLDRKPKELSGGQRQRVAIGRAIVRKPKIFLFDEPLSNLDAELRVQMRLELARLHKLLKTTMIYVTHDQVEAMTLADRIVVLRDGRIEQCGAPMELYTNPANSFVAGFIGSPRMNFITADLQRDRNGFLNVTFGDLGGGPIVFKASEGADMTKPSRVTIGIRPEHLTVGPTAKCSIELRPGLLERLGSVTWVHGALSDGVQVVATLHGHDEPLISDIAHAGFDPKHCFLFDEEGNRIYASPAD